MSSGDRKIAEKFTKYDENGNEITVEKWNKNIDNIRLGTI